MAKSDHAEFLAFSRRIMRALSKRLGDADPEDLAEMVELRNTLDSAIGAAVRAQRAAGFSWADIAAPLGISRQAAQQRWGKLAEQDTDANAETPRRVSFQTNRTMTAQDVADAKGGQA